MKPVPALSHPLRPHSLNPSPLPCTAYYTRNAPDLGAHSAADLRHSRKLTFKLSMAAIAENDGGLQAGDKVFVTCIDGT